jgi:hypothetical protein
MIDSGMSNTVHTLEIVRWLGRFIPVSICDRDVCERSHFSASSYCVIESFFLIDLMADPMFIAFVLKKLNSVYGFLKESTFYKCCTI